MAIRCDTCNKTGEDVTRYVLKLEAAPPDSMSASLAIAGKIDLCHEHWAELFGAMQEKLQLMKDPQGVGAALKAERDKARLEAAGK
jgi:hypothetical protein